MLIKDHILNFYRNLYADSNLNVHITGSMEDFIGTYRSLQHLEVN